MGGVKRSPSKIPALHQEDDGLHVAPLIPPKLKLSGQSRWF